MKTAILARHGESEYSARGAVNGDPRIVVRLTDRGRGEAQRLGEELASERIDLAATSEFARAIETADIALAGRQVLRLVLPELNDIGIGEFEGKTLDEYRGWARSFPPDAVSPGGAESRVSAVRRYVAAFRRLLERPEETILVVAHSLPIRYVLNAVDKLGPAPEMALVEHAKAYPLPARALRLATDRLDAWTSEPVWPGLGASNE
jgi:broad specificity phosphatase PhoE